MRAGAWRGAPGLHGPRGVVGERIALCTRVHTKCITHRQVLCARVHAHCSRAAAQRAPVLSVSSKSNTHTRLRPAGSGVTAGRPGDASAPIAGCGGEPATAPDEDEDDDAPLLLLPLLLLLLLLGGDEGTAYACVGFCCCCCC